MVRSYKNILLSTLILGISFGTTSVFATDPEVDLSVTVNPSLTLSVSSNSVNLPITPDADGEYNTTNFTITSATNNMYGYTLTMSTEDNHTYLESTTVDPTLGTKPQIQSLASSQDGISAETFTAATTEANGLNRWGIAIGSGNYNAVTSPKEVKKTITNNASGSDTTTVNIAAKLNLAVPAGTYKNKFIIQMVANPMPGTLEAAYQNAGKTKATIGSKQYYAMQDMTSTICNNVSLIGDEIEVYDTRDNTIYHIGKLADNRCWLLDNLALDLTNSTILNRLTADNTNADATALGYLKGTTTRDPETDPNGNYATAGAANWTDYSYSYTAPLINMSSKDVIPQGDYDPLRAETLAGNWKVGGYYNYCAVSAGSFCYGDPDKYDISPSDEATNDICPSGWRMPTGGGTGAEFHTLSSIVTGTPYEVTNPDDYRKLRMALHVPLSGGFVYSHGRGEHGHFWSSTYDSSYNSFILYMDTSWIFPEMYDDRKLGFPVRCIAQ